MVARKINARPVKCKDCAYRQAVGSMIECQWDGPVSIPLAFRDIVVGNNSLMDADTTHHCPTFKAG